METLFTLAIGLSVTVFFVRRHVKALPPERASAGHARRKAGGGVHKGR